ncbi:ZIP family metal transporter [Sphingomonas carotinifaciens]|uniref:ZIP family zinc transporter n=1 Tax=Sphingomonas carotinifaciens TaxID=1166323 RepID=A0A1G7J5R5_9SPHN|nr:ZIP family zinc transporter [Sphingomonas carotinifaciens]MBB4084617.1 ZIP family zinc transporter [Sphingomonas carotinifaciens]MWC44007.1 ZIP family zinc transporter [Sphingomonas carotinifaciens]SDF20322.1 zinc transporter, ZIP family [Sphingomonas carotinifaciens]
MHQVATAGLWGLVGGSALILGAAIPYLVTLPQRMIAAIMAIGSGVLISAVAFDLMDEAYAQGGFDSTAAGFVGGAAVYTLANIIVSRQGARHRKRSGSNPQEKQPDAGANSGLAIAIGALLDGIPESVVIGTSLLSGGGVSAVMVAAVFLSNVPEGLASAAGMKRSGRSPTYVFGVWIGIALASGLAAMIGNAALAGAAPDILAAVTAVAAGAILAMLVDTMIPEATESTHDYSGMIAVIGFLAAFILTKLGG